MRGWELILRVYGGTSVLARGATLATRWLDEPHPANQQSPSGVGVSTARGAVSTRVISVFVPGLSELSRY